ncbi:PITH domain-containing protein [Chloropicon primus]|uniref:PITH domain-containing protein n=1 Tax=Chloropicon primus TaxID=1764295 RepID=A0A5B8MHL0_9CHLO|nr:PITH domain-containing protein [Chloropicon primus]UPQ98776.1 PITH domain-containing protein [Chloropicon primus]|mmetsp:Transcript_4320/g.12702  ORF Transcript_4320/g.12702 Transcript_4320/m.12702 type:complete len:206 (+) Transcript_4320:136-753(+)|eukprot:QDZ19564.1 PITH domain-containing protein [Chloropicon primus]
MEGASCAHDHDCGDHDCGSMWRLNQFVDTPKVRALNEEVQGSCKELFRGWEERLDRSKCCSSEEDDPELIIHVPFTCDVKLKSICVIGGLDDTSPKLLKVFLNREDVDFTNASDLPPVQEWELLEDPNGVFEYNTKFRKFQAVSSITMYFPESYGGNQTKIHFIGFKGEATQNQRDKIVNAVYEVKPIPEDHKAGNDEMAMKSIF